MLFFELRHYKTDLPQISVCLDINNAPGKFLRKHYHNTDMKSIANVLLTNITAKTKSLNKTTVCPVFFSPALFHRKDTFLIRMPKTDSRQNNFRKFSVVIGPEQNFDSRYIINKPFEMAHKHKHTQTYTHTHTHLEPSKRGKVSKIKP